MAEHKLVVPPYLLSPITEDSVSAVSQCVGHAAKPGSAHSYLKDLQQKPPVQCYSAYKQIHDLNVSMLAMTHYHLNHIIKKMTNIAVINL